MTLEIHLPLYADSVTDHAGGIYALVKAQGDQPRRLYVMGDTTGFTGEPFQDDALLCPLTPENASTLRSRLPWLNPQPLGTHISAGFGDRLGIATPGHIAATAGTGVAPIFAQQSVRENERTGRSPQQVMDDAMWGVFACGWTSAWGADADHLKTPEDVLPFVEAGYTFFTIDPGAHVDDAATTDDPAILREKAARLPWDALASSPEDLVARLQGRHTLDGLTLDLDETALMRAAVKYGGAIAHTLTMANHIAALQGERGFDLEMSVDETGTTTELTEHFVIASELKRLGVAFVSLAPRFVGSFEKGVDYIGDLDELDANIAGHAAIMRYFGNSYKLSLHTGSDKFGVYPLAVKHTGGLVHLKTAGTSYLEALRAIAHHDTAFFREVLDFARERYDEDRRTYHVSATVAKVPASADLSDDALPGLLDQFDARQVLHVTFGSVLDRYGDRLHAFLGAHEADYHAYLKAHFDRHLVAFRQG